MKIYVGCALTHASDEFRQEVEEFKNKLRELGHEVLDFVGLKAGTPKDVYEYDVSECTTLCDLFIAIINLPSTGLGFELATRVKALGKPTIMLKDKNAHVTRLLHGLSEVEGVPLVDYTNLLEDGLEAVVWHINTDELLAR